MTTTPDTPDPTNDTAFSNKHRYPWADTFLEVLRDTGSVFRAAKTAGIQRRRVYTLRKKDSEFAALWDEALGSALDEVERCLFVRAQKKSDLAAIFLLKHRRPEIYADNNKLTVRMEPSKEVLEEIRRQREALAEEMHKRDEIPAIPWPRKVRGNGRS